MGWPVTGLRPPASSHAASPSCACAAAAVILGSNLNMLLPNIWLWDMVDEFVYQFQSFCQYRYDVTVPTVSARVVPLWPGGPLLCFPSAALRSSEEMVASFIRACMWPACVACLLPLHAAAMCHPTKRVSLRCSAQPVGRSTRACAAPARPLHKGRPAGVCRVHAPLPAAPVPCCPAPSLSATTNLPGNERAAARPRGP